MIRIQVSQNGLRQQIAGHEPDWLEDAARLTRELESEPDREIVSTWSPIKQVFMDLQYSKCVFCEKEVEDQPIEQDVEHFRPKNNVQRWTVPDWLAEDEGIEVTQPGAGAEPGYRLLAYNCLNYAAACKTCNSTRKRNYFPIAGPVRNSTAKDPLQLGAEQAYLIYPISDVDDDPEDLIEFYATSPRAKLSGGFERKRALVTIEMFQLDDTDGRPYLFKQRAKNICMLCYYLQRIADGTISERAEGERVADYLTSPQSGHTNCMRCFRRLFEVDRPEAEAVAAVALDLWLSGSP